MQLTFGNITLREEQIDYQPGPKGRIKAKKHLALIFDLLSPCGDRWLNVVTIHEPDKANPGLEITNKCGTSGVQGIQRILVLLEEWRMRKGLEVSMAGAVFKELQDDEA